MYWAVFLLLVIVLALILVHAGWVVARTLKLAGQPPEAPRTRTHREVRGAPWYRHEAVRLAQAGRYAEAMSADFVGLLLELEARQLVRYEPGKTPNEYTYEAKLAAPSRQGFQELVRALYRHAFAGEPCGPEEFRAWRERTRAEHYAAAH